MSDKASMDRGVGWILALSDSRNLGRCVSIEVRCHDKMELPVCETLYLNRQLFVCFRGLEGRAGQLGACNDGLIVFSGREDVALLRKGVVLISLHSILIELYLRYRALNSSSTSSTCFGWRTGGT